MPSNSTMARMRLFQELVLAKGIPDSSVAVCVATISSGGYRKLAARDSRWRALYGCPSIDGNSANVLGVSLMCCSLAAVAPLLVHPALAGSSSETQHFFRSGV